MYVDTLQQRIRLGEDSTLELKRVAVSPAGKVTEPHADGLSDELAALANAAGGMLVLGVDDKTRAVTGIPLAQMDQVDAWVSSICTDRIKPPLDVVTRHLELTGEDRSPRAVIVVDVPRSLWVMERRGFGVETILTESEQLSGRRPVYEQIGGLELCLTIFAASPPERDAPQADGSETA